MTLTQWQPSRHSDVPLHRQIEQYMKDKILHGEWAVGTKIPSQRTLADMFQVNRSTVTAAIDELTSQGLVEGRRGGGTKVVNSTWSVLAAEPPLDWNDYVRSGIHHPNSSIIQGIHQNEPRADIIRIGTGELSPDLLPVDTMRRMFQQINPHALSLGYEQPKGNPKLREAVADHLKSKQIHVSPSAIFIVSGALQALQLISIGLLKRGSVILTEKPSYLQSLHVFQSAGMRLRGLPMDESGIKTGLVSSYRKQYGGQLLYTIPSFHNPTGTVMSEQRRKEIIDLSKKEQLPIIEDDAYGDLWFEEKPAQPLKAMDHEGNVLYVGTFSKTVSPGLRIGWLAGPEPVIERLADIKMQTDYGSSGLSQWAAAEWLSQGHYEKHLTWIRGVLKQKRDAAVQFLKRYAGDIATWRIPAGGFYIWVTFHKPLPVSRFFHELLKQQVLVNPGSIYNGEERSSIRLSYSYASLADLETGIQAAADTARRLMMS
ncbi:MocR-like pyridoxine biosynthesis transcription factor PdxR [Bacillus vallismortis]|uniref:MocR-like pyridoxine biosynthesis transcription factor PdxR n=1 Tax=Bacillus vallismortis TaxID=72361 RepID=UPI00227E8D86|nr:PLP-dependent aminotransferase family protein [Bacillus vallismortis]MCY8307906.1 PLP-dependent aminotransferase family protein [Bacillus vallismortis]MCY8597198.1 PLP-dependent aminotransferase family protein [Bacillus vallismortis]MEC1790461.1 PLP-dependent aminotransferase family protein [Bacillus vallismortis]